jgi:hypothetical protein
VHRCFQYQVFISAMGSSEDQVLGLNRQIQLLIRLIIDKRKESVMCVYKLVSSYFVHLAYCRVSFALSLFYTRGQHRLNRTANDGNYGTVIMYTSSLLVG